jgi:hypothetical protein
MADTVYTVRKDRRSGVDDSIKRGPTHRVNVANQTWCGVKIVGFSSWNDNGNTEDVDCVKCQRAFRLNKPQAWRRW